MSSCLLCTHEVLRETPMHDEAAVLSVAHDVLQGMIGPMRGGIDAFRPPRRGVCLVERCARFVETPCGGCRRANCQRCLIAAELRAAENRLNAERDAEIAAQGDQFIDDVIDKIVGELCEQHGPFGAALLGQWRAQN